LGRYILIPKVYNKFKTLGYDLNCKICGCPINIGEEVESKSGSKGPKLYHAECYDRFHLNFKDHKILNGYGELIAEEKVDESGDENDE